MTLVRLHSRLLLRCGALLLFFPSRVLFEGEAFQTGGLGGLIPPFQRPSIIHDVHLTSVLATTAAGAASQDGAPTILFVDRIVLLSGTSMQVLSSFPETQSTTEKPLLLFLHGSFHGAWCWAEHYFDYFCSAGYPCVAISWRGTGGTPAGPDTIRKVKISEHVQDLGTLLEQLPSILQRHGWESTDARPVVLCHSFGGLAVMKYLEIHAEPPFRGVVTMCSVPPSGNGKMTMRFLRRSLKASWKITDGFALKRCLHNPSLCRELFFGGNKIMDGDTVVEDYGISDEDVARYQRYFARDSAATIDLMDLARQLPSASTASDGRATFFDTLRCSLPFLVIGASDDFLVDRDGLDETARYFGLKSPLIVDSPHDIMLGAKWQNGANAVKVWLEQNIVKSS
jgi:pimeloyl-ACP methyl ester carboxylesterase